MAYIICEVNGYILGIGQNQATSGGVPELEYNNIAEIFQNKPISPDGYTYKLRADDLEWMMVETETIDEEAGPEDYEQALQQMGVDFND